MKWKCFGNLVDCVVGGDDSGNPCFQYLNMLITYNHVWSCTYPRRWRRERESDRERERETREIYMWLLHTMKRWNMVYLLFAFARHSSSALELSLFDSSLSIHKCSVVSTVGTCMLPPPSLHKSVSCCHERGGCLEVIPNKSSQCVEK